MAPTEGSIRLQAAVSSGSGTDSDSDGCQSETEGDAVTYGNDEAEEHTRHTAQRNPTGAPSTHPLPGPDAVNSEPYLESFGTMPIQDAVLDTFCRAARLGGALFSETFADTPAITGAEIDRMDAEAEALGVDCVQVLYGHVNTTKLHRLVQHLGDELRARGNLWEGNTSENERLHASCKRMFNRSNKRGPDVALQMMRCDEAQSAVLGELQEFEDDATANAVAPEDGDDGGGSDAAPPTQTAIVSFTGRVRRIADGDIHRAGVLCKLGALLGVKDTKSVTLHSTARTVARFEWGAPRKIQYLRGNPTS